MPQSMYIVGAGMVSSLGAGLVPSCAAARAGVRRGRELPDLVLAAVDDGEAVSPVGHAIEWLTHGFEGRARLLRLLVAALEDLRSRWSTDTGHPLNAGVYLSVPEPARLYTELDRVARPERRRALEEEAASFEPEAAEEVAGWLWGKAASLTDLPRIPLVFAATGRTGFTRALMAARRDLMAGRIQAAIVGGVDSLLDPETLLWLHDTRRLKSPDMPVGIEPGEAAAVVVLAARPGAERTPGPLTLSVPSADAARPATLRRALEHARREANLVGPPLWMIADHDGSSQRGAEWGRAMMHLREETDGRGVALTYPAISFGDVGAAWGAVSTCMALAALSRGYAPTACALIATGDDDGVYLAHAIHRERALTQSPTAR